MRGLLGGHEQMLTGPTVLPIVEVVAGGLDLALGGRLLWRCWRARRWPTRGGQILSANLKQRGAAWVLEVQYRYMAGAYTSREISPGGSPTFLTEELGRLAIAQKWQPGTPVKVY